MTHLDLFSGIGGFALAADRVWENVEHIFVEYDPFCREVLKKHWPEAEIHGDIREFVADTKRSGLQKSKHDINSTDKKKTRTRMDNRPERQDRPFILTGGFPCQPFSQAGRRKGTDDDRYLWPPMFEAITIFKPRWVIAENVAGLVTWSDGMVLEQVCTDLESEGYEVQPFVIPACAVNAPHRRDRVWIVAHSKRGGCETGRECESVERLQERRKNDTSTFTQPSCRNAPDTSSSRLERSNWSQGDGRTKADNDAPHTEHRRPEQEQRQHRISSETTRQETDASSRNCDWDEPWPEVATRLCRVDDELSYWVDGRGKKRNSRNPRLKALGNAIVPAVAEQIMRRMITTN